MLANASELSMWWARLESNTCEQRRDVKAFCAHFEAVLTALLVRFWSVVRAGSVLIPSLILDGLPKSNFGWGWYIQPLRLIAQRRRSPPPVTLIGATI